MEQKKYPTREQVMHELEAVQPICQWQGPTEAVVYKVTRNVTKDISHVLLAMHDEIDRLRGCLRDIQGELLFRFDSHELPNLNMIEMAQKIDKWLSADEVGD